MTTFGVYSELAQPVTPRARLRFSVLQVVINLSALRRALGVALTVALTPRRFCETR